MHNLAYQYEIVFYLQRKTLILKISIPGLLLNFFTGFGVPEWKEDFCTESGILRALLRNEFPSGLITPFLLLGRFFRFPIITSGWAPVTAVTIVGTGVGVLVVVLGVVVDFVGGGPHIRSGKSMIWNFGIKHVHLFNKLYLQIIVHKLFS